MVFARDAKTAFLRQKTFLLPWVIRRIGEMGCSVLRPALVGAALPLFAPPRSTSRPLERFAFRAWREAHLTGFSNSTATGRPTLAPHHPLQIASIADRIHCRS